MIPPRGSGEEAAAFLRGDPAHVASVEEAVRLTVRSFQFGDLDTDRDLVQESLSRVLGNLAAGKFRGESSLRTYARNIARYTCLEHIRRRRWQVELDPESLTSSDRGAEPEGSFLWAEEHLRNLQAFAELPSESRELLKLVCVEGVSYRDAAARLGISEAAIKSRLHRCRLAIREAAGLRDREPRRGRRKESP